MPSVSPIALAAVSPVATTGVLLVALGNGFCHDDGVGPAVVESALQMSEGSELGPAIRAAGTDGSPLSLLDIFDEDRRSGHDRLLVVVDALCSGRPPGSITMTWLGTAAPPSTLGEGGQSAPSTHGLGFAQVYRLAACMSLLPEHMALIGVEGADFSKGEGLSPAVTAAVAPAARLVLRVAEAALAGPSPLGSSLWGD